MNTIKLSLAERIGNHLILNSPGLPQASIANGQAGDAVCLYSMYRKTGIELYEEIAGQLLDSVYEKRFKKSLRCYLISMYFYPTLFFVVSTRAKPL